MLRDGLSNRVILVGIAVCVLIVGGSLLHFWLVKRTTDAEFPRTTRDAVEGNDQAVTQDTGGTSPVDFGDAAPGLDAEAASSVSTDTDAARPSETDAEVLEGIELSETDTAAADEPAEEVEVSPYGFGPYPEVPPEFPFTFPMSSPNHEVLARVWIKLISQGVYVEAVEWDNGRIYPSIPGTVYVRWAAYEGPAGPERYISEVLATVADGLRLRDLRLEKGRSLREEDIPPDLKLVPFEGNGIDPYQFLDLPERSHP